VWEAVARLQSGVRADECTPIERFRGTLGGIESGFKGGAQFPWPECTEREPSRGLRDESIIVLVGPENVIRCKGARLLR
jgi:hypothetical protein